MAWWRRRNGSEPVDARPATGAAASQSAPAAPAALPPVQRQAWQDLPPLQRVVTPTPAIAPLDSFSNALSSWQNPSFLAPLAHLVDPDGPSGHVEGLAGPAAPHATSPRSELPVVPRAKVKPDALVQRLVMNPTIPATAPMAASQPRFAPAVTAAAPSAPSFVTSPEPPVLHRVAALESAAPAATPGGVVQRHADPHDDAPNPAENAPVMGAPAEENEPVQRIAVDGVPADEITAPTIGAGESVAAAAGSDSRTAGAAPSDVAQGHGRAPAGPSVQRHVGPAATPVADSAGAAPAMPFTGAQRPAAAAPPAPAPASRPLGLGAPLQRATTSPVAQPHSAPTPTPTPAPGPSPIGADRAGPTADSARHDDPLTLPTETSGGAHHSATSGEHASAAPVAAPLAATDGPVSSAPTLGLQRSIEQDPVDPGPHLGHEHATDPAGADGADTAIDVPALPLSRAAAEPPGSATAAGTAAHPDAGPGADGFPPGEGALPAVASVQRQASDAGSPAMPDHPDASAPLPLPLASTPLLGVAPAGDHPAHESPSSAIAPAVRRGLGAPLPAAPAPHPGDPALQRSATPPPGSGAPAAAPPTPSPTVDDSRVTVRAMSLADMFAPGEAAVASGAAVPDGSGSYVFHRPTEQAVPPAAAPAARPAAPLVEMPVAQRFSLPGRDLLSSASSAVSNARSAASGLGDSARSAAGGYLDSARSAAGGYADSARSAATGAMDSARSTASGYVNSAQSAAGGYLDQAHAAGGGLLNSARSAAGGYLDQASGAASALGDRASGALGGLADQAGGAAQSAIGTVQQAASGVAGQVSDAAAGAADAAGGAASGLMSAASGAAGGLAGAAAGAANALPTDLDELARRLFDPLSARLRNELWMDRERAGLVTDLRR